MTVKQWQDSSTVAIKLIRLLILIVKIFVMKVVVKKIPNLGSEVNISKGDFHCSI